MLLQAKVENQERGGETIMDLVHLVGEAVEVVDGGVPALDDVDGGLGGLPVGGHDEDGGGALREHLVLPGQEEVPRR